MKKLFRSTTVALTAMFLLNGCIGVAVQTTRTQKFQDPSVADNARASGLGQRNFNQTNAVDYTAAWLNAHWGKPSRISSAGDGSQDEVWAYKFDTIWSGVVPIVLIPIPILLPTGRAQVLFYLRDGRVVSGELRESHSTGGAFGLSVGPCTFNFGPFSLSD